MDSGCAMGGAPRFFACLGWRALLLPLAFWLDMMRAIIKMTIIATIQNNTFPTLASVQNDVDHKTAASIRQQQKGETHQCPAQGDAPAPAPHVAAQQQYAEGKPGQ